MNAPRTCRDRRPKAEVCKGDLPAENLRIDAVRETCCAPHQPRLTVHEAAQCEGLNLLRIGVCARATRVLPVLTFSGN